MPSSGPASIAVALPNGQNYCWDAGACRLRYAWPGDFIDAERHFSGNGSAQAKIPTKRYWRAPETGFPIRLVSKDGEAKDLPAVRFKGYKLVAGKPRFDYSIGDMDVSEFIEEIASGDGLRRHFVISEPSGPIEFRIASEKGRQTCSVGKEEEGWVRLSPEEAKNFTITVLP